MRRVPTRYVLARSVSECHDDAILSSEDLQLMEDEVVSMEDLSMIGTNNGTPLSVCAEVDEETAMDSNDSWDEAPKPSEY